MADDEATSHLLWQLDGIANAPMTASQRERRAQPLLDAAGLSAAEVARATARAELPWNTRKAQEYGVPPETWLRAVSTAELPTSESLADLLARLHRAEAAAGLLKAGYTPSRDPSGRLIWSGRS